MLRLVVIGLVLFVLFKYIRPHIRIMRIIKGEHNAKYSKDEWEKIKRQLKK